VWVDLPLLLEDGVQEECPHALATVARNHPFPSLLIALSCVTHEDILGLARRRPQSLLSTTISALRRVHSFELIIVAHEQLKVVEFSHAFALLEYPFLH
jgi:hypothetical protein